MAERSRVDLIVIYVSIKQKQDVPVLRESEKRGRWVGTRHQFPSWTICREHADLER